MTRVVILKYGMGNIDSVVRAVEECGGHPAVAERPEDLDRATHIIVPGVGAYSVGMANIRDRGFREKLEDEVMGRGVPILGICLGMQFMATKGLEGGETQGFGWIPGEVTRLVPSSPDERIPHIGWNNVSSVGSPALFSGIPRGKDFYFVHSYHLACRGREHIIATTPYCGTFVSAVQREHIVGVQFHPEKSQKAGFQLIRNFLSMERCHA
jgi:glutamine amidotransferase